MVDGKANWMADVMAEKLGNYKGEALAPRLVDGMA